MIDIESLADKVAQRLRETRHLPDEKARMFRYAREAVRGTGIKNQDDLDRIFRNLTRELARHSAAKRTAEAARKRPLPPRREAAE